MLLNAGLPFKWFVTSIIFVRLNIDLFLFLRDWLLNITKFVTYIEELYRYFWEMCNTNSNKKIWQRWQRKQEKNNCERLFTISQASHDHSNTNFLNCFDIDSPVSDVIHITSVKTLLTANQAKTTEVTPSYVVTSIVNGKKVVLHGFHSTRGWTLEKCNCGPEYLGGLKGWLLFSNWLFLH